MPGPKWLWGKVGGWARRAAAAVLAAGPVPRHVALCMDGNRRYAQARHMRQVEGHTFGYRRLIDALEWCLELGVRYVSVYAFSIDNYRRCGEEVDTLMALAEEKLAHMLQEYDVLVRHGVQVRVVGDLSLAPAAVQVAATRIMEATAQHDRAVLNLCFSYTASEELQRALDDLAAHPAPSSSSGSGSLTAAGLDGQLYTRGCPPVDLLVRTSGETRLSDFLLWQCRHALLVFTPVLWPDFGFLDLVAAVLEFQRHAPRLQRLRHAAEAQAAGTGGAVRVAATCGTVVEAAADEAADQGFYKQLQAVSVALQKRQGSPRSVASPASPSSPSSCSEEYASAMPAAVAAEATDTLVLLRHRPPVASAGAQQYQSGAIT